MVWLLFEAKPWVGNMAS